MPVSSVTYGLSNLTGPFRVNTNVGGSQSMPEVAGLANGGFAVGYGNVGLDFFKSPTDRVSVGVDQFPDPSASQDSKPVLTQLSNGNVLAVWEDNTSANGYKIHGRLYTENGISLGTELNLTPIPDSVIAYHPYVTARANGGFLLTWSNFTGFTEGHDGNVFVAAYNNAGGQIYTHQASQADTSESFGHRRFNYEGTVAELAGGGFVVTYDHIEDPKTFNGPFDFNYHLRAVIYNDDGSVRVPDFLIEASDDGRAAQPAIAALHSGGFVVVYRNDKLAGEGDTSGLTLRVIGPTGNVGPSIHVNTGSAADELDPAVTVLANDFIVVTWTRQSDNADIFGRVFDHAGNPVDVNGSGQFLIRDSGEVFNDQHSRVAHLLDGQFVTAWQENTPGDGAGAQITARVIEVVRTTLGSDQGDNFSGDELRDTIVGGNGNDVFDAGGGKDFVSGGGGNDTLRGGDGDDTVFGSTGDDRLEGGNGNDTLRGDVGFDTLIGGMGNDDLDGGADFDTLAGGTGDDSYTLSSGASHDVGGGLFLVSFDTVTENAGEGTDTVFVQRVQSGFSVLTSYTLPANVENGTIIGTSAFTLIGNNLPNTLTGNAAANTFDGLGGDDTITAGGGDDTVIFRHGGGHDTWLDFTAGAGTPDRLNLKDFTNIRTLEEVQSHATQSGTDTIIDLGNGDTVKLSGISKASLSADDFILGPPLPVLSSSDYDGNSHGDMLWRRDDGAISIWDNGAIGSAHVIAGSGVVPASWNVAGTGDFDGNGHQDILWRNDDGTVSIWDDGDISKAHVVAGTNVNGGPISNSWHIAGTGDFDGNNKTDILWRHDDGTVSIWDNGTVSGAHVVAGTNVNGGPIPSSWHIAGTGDFDGNHQSDILWRNDNGTVSIWDNGTVSGAHVIAAAGVVPNSWHIAGTGDFAHDTRTDIIWRNDDGAVSMWDNGLIASAHILSGSGVVPIQWHIVGIGDFAGDGSADLLWRHDNGAVSIWDNGLLSGAHVIANAGVVPNDWHIV